jgi:hypothetical protein
MRANSKPDEFDWLIGKIMLFGNWRPLAFVRGWLVELGGGFFRDFLSSFPTKRRASSGGKK